MKMSLLLKKLHIENKEFVTASELKAYCGSMKLDYSTVVRYFAGRGYLVRIFRGVFYVKSIEELKLGRSRYNHLELVARGLDLKNVHNWYFGLHTALKLNNMTHEHFAVEDVISDTLFRANPTRIAEYKSRFIKLSPHLLKFGISKADKDVRYSDPEKTVLDFIYIWRYNGIPEQRIRADISGWTRNTSRHKLRRYAAKYPKTVADTVARVV
jgi:predicted transcriptional regulator of viral defense system